MEHIVKVGDTDSVIIVRRDGSEAHLPSSIVKEIIAALQETVDMYEDAPLPDKEANAEITARLTELVEWLPEEDLPASPLADLYVTLHMHSSPLHTFEMYSPVPDPKEMP